MTNIVKNWILKANNDFKTGKDENDEAPTDQEPNGEIKDLSINK